MALAFLKGIAPLQKMIAPLAAMPTQTAAAPAYAPPVPEKLSNPGFAYFGDAGGTTPFGFGGIPQKSVNVGMDYGWSAQPQAPAPAPPSPSGAVNGGGMANLGGAWSGVDQWDAAISAAAAKYGVPANLVKAVMKLESNGDPNAVGAPGVWGPMQVNSNAWGQGPWSTDPAANIDKGVQILADAYKQAGSWDGALIAYRGGWGSDGYTTGQQYLDIVNGNWQQLNAQAGGGYGQVANGMNTGSGTAQGALTSMFGAGAGVPDWGEFNVPSDLGYYTYGNQYGLSGDTHTGVDVPLNPGSSMFAPFSGHVVCAGTGNGTGEDSCAAFACQGFCVGGSAGRIEIMSDDGNTILIYGHSSTAAVAPGQHVGAGSLLGTSGGMNSGHVHLEARVRDPSTPSGWRIVDPRTVLGGGFATATGGAAAANPYAAYGDAGRLLAFMHR